MTASGTPQDDESGLEQEGIWDAPSDAPPDSQTDAADSAGRRGATPSRGLAAGLTSTERVPGPSGFFYADVPNRIMALIVDVIVVAVIGFVLAWLLGGLVTRSGALDSAGGDLDVGVFLLATIIMLVIGFTYFGSLWVWLATTLGMRLLGLRIGTASDGSALTVRQALVRWLIVGVPAVMASMAIWVPNLIGVIIAVVGVCWLLLLLYTMTQSPTRQGLHDRVAGTIVVRARRRAA